MLLQCWQVREQNMTAGGSFSEHCHTDIAGGWTQHSHKQHVRHDYCGGYYADLSLVPRNHFLAPLAEQWLCRTRGLMVLKLSSGNLCSTFVRTLCKRERATLQVTLKVKLMIKSILIIWPLWYYNKNQMLWYSHERMWNTWWPHPIVGVRSSPGTGHVNARKWLSLEVSLHCLVAKELP